MRLWGRGVATAFGLLAVALSLYLPIHIAGDIVAAAMDALATDSASICHGATAVADAGNAEGGAHHHGAPHHHHDNTCPICGSVSTAASATLLPTPVPLAAPESIGLALAVERATELNALSFHTPYAARAPPLSA